MKVGVRRPIFLSTLSLRRATAYRVQLGSMVSISIHALLAESDASYCCRSFWQEISIHALLAESDGKSTTLTRIACISIHALLAESDDVACGDRHKLRDFYPRSPCGERPSGKCAVSSAMSFLSTLSLRRATQSTQSCDLSILFLSTLSLRRATSHHE